MALQSEVPAPRAGTLGLAEGKCAGRWAVHTVLAEAGLHGPVIPLDLWRAPHPGIWARVCDPSLLLEALQGTNAGALAPRGRWHLKHVHIAWSIPSPPKVCVPGDTDGTAPRAHPDHGSTKDQRNLPVLVSDVPVWGTSRPAFALSSTSKAERGP